MINNLYTDKDYNNIIERINQLNAESTPTWGKMSVGEMLDHCAEVLSTYNGKPLKTPLIARVLKGYIRKMVLSEKPFKKGIDTNPQFIARLNPDFESSKNRLLNELKIFKTTPLEEIRKIKHALFGYLSPEDRGWAQYKHLNHHLEQFGV